ncbi:hypothetical protein [Mesorhizobium sp. B2-3-4]|uniref:hypothetical protein n=1 Tax=Mesorhizobium sp. B2-3-4 TaxID=2589959 RepID=UPI00112DB7ED|nr:hypothetical protein [Mesorhizobium sp. B2-3-4]TPM31454.1 hypothetical protein FJ967_24755 [Mesorhizobium sp. B2-3-4]
MQTNPTKHIPWRDRAFVTIAEAGQIVARSPSWVRDRIGEGRLRGCRVTPGGPLAVEVRSLARLVDSAVSGVPAPHRAPALRLVVDNT